MYSDANSLAKALAGLYVKNVENNEWPITNCNMKEIAAAKAFSDSWTDIHEVHR